MTTTKFTNDHEWLRLEANGAITVGITDYAQSNLGDLVYIQLPEADTDYKRGDEVAVIESVKTAGGIAMPFDGKVIEVNNALNDDPGAVNSDPMGAGWFFKMSADVSQLSSLMDEAAYKAFIATLS